MLGCESLSTTKLFHCSVFREVTYTEDLDVLGDLENFTRIPPPSEYNPWEKYSLNIFHEIKIPCTMCTCAQLNSLMTEILLEILTVGVNEQEENKLINQLIEDTVVSI